VKKVPLKSQPTNSILLVETGKLPIVLPNVQLRRPNYSIGLITIILPIEPLTA